MSFLSLATASHSIHVYKYVTNLFSQNRFQFAHVVSSHALQQRPIMWITIGSFVTVPESSNITKWGQTLMNKSKCHVTKSKCEPFSTKCLAKKLGISRSSTTAYGGQELTLRTAHTERHGHAQSAGKVMRYRKGQRGMRTLVRMSILVMSHASDENKQDPAFTLSTMPQRAYCATINLVLSPVKHHLWTS